MMYVCMYVCMYAHIQVYMLSHLLHINTFYLLFVFIILRIWYIHSYIHTLGHRPPLRPQGDGVRPPLPTLRPSLRSWRGGWRLVPGDSRPCRHQGALYITTTTTTTYCNCHYYHHLHVWWPLYCNCHYHQNYHTLHGLLPLYYYYHHYYHPLVVVRPRWNRCWSLFECGFSPKTNTWNCRWMSPSSNRSTTNSFRNQYILYVLHTYILTMSHLWKAHIYVIHTYIHCVSSCQGELLLKELQKHCDVILRHRVESHVSTIIVEHSEIIRLTEVESISTRSHIHIHPDLAEIFTHSYIHTFIHSVSGQSSDYGYSESLSSISYTRPAAQPNPLQQQVHTFIHTYILKFILLLYLLKGVCGAESAPVSFRQCHTALQWRQQRFEIFD